FNLHSLPTRRSSDLIQDHLPPSSDIGKSQKAIKCIAVLWPNGPLFPSSPVTDKIPASLKTIIVYPDHVAVFQFSFTMFKAVGHRSEEHTSYSSHVKI